jgi:hypothetical protein
LFGCAASSVTQTNKREGAIVDFDY